MPLCRNMGILGLVKSEKGNTEEKLEFILYTRFHPCQRLFQNSSDFAQDDKAVSISCTGVAGKFRGQALRGRSK